MRTETVYFESGGFGNFAVHIDGLSTFMRFLQNSDQKMQKAIMEGLSMAAQPVLVRARANASKIMDDGTYSNSLYISSVKSKARILLRSNDPAAPVKEFAKIGAKTISSKGTPLANARLKKRSGVGVPRRAYAPRAMVSAVNASHELVKDRIDMELAKVLERWNNG